MATNAINRFNIFASKQYKPNANTISKTKKNQTYCIVQPYRLSFLYKQNNSLKLKVYLDD
jgi:hypothetical protein